jgi:hypothetical protein
MGVHCASTAAAFDHTAHSLLPAYTPGYSISQPASYSLTAAACWHSRTWPAWLALGLGLSDQLAASLQDRLLSAHLPPAYV